MLFGESADSTEVSEKWAFEVPAFVDEEGGDNVGFVRERDAFDICDASMRSGERRIRAGTRSARRSMIALFNTVSCESRPV